MKLTSHSFRNGEPLPAEFAAGRRDGDSVGFGANRNPHLAWSEIPAATRSLALVCVDPDVPTVAEMVGAPGIEIPDDQPRCDFTHWLLIDIPPSVSEIAAGACSDGFVAHGKQAPAGPTGSRQGRNDYSAWFAGNPDLAGDYLGYDGPFPPPNDLRLHRYFFRLFALDCPHLPLPERFGYPDLLRTLHGHILAETAIHASYSLHPARTGQTG